MGGSRSGCVSASRVAGSLSRRGASAVLPGGCERVGNAAKARALYATPLHRRRRRLLEPVVATGTVRCARGAHCLRAEWVDGELVGGLILPGEPWHLGHPDDESVGGPEHRRCNVGAPRGGGLRMRRRGEPRAGAAMVWGSEPPAFSIGWRSRWGVGFRLHVLFDDAPDPDDVEPYETRRRRPGSADPPGLPPRGHPEIGRGLDIAREHLVADLDDAAIGSSVT